MSATTNLHHGMTKRELARHVADPYAAGHGGWSVASTNVSRWYIGEIEQTHLDMHAHGHMDAEMQKALVILGLPRPCERCGDPALYVGGVCASCLALDAGARFENVTA